MNQNSTAFTVSVHPIQQEPGLWFANYMISEYRDGLECVVANVSRRHITFASEAKAKQAARSAGNSAVASMRPHAYGSAAENRHRRVRNGAV